MSAFAPLRAARLGIIRPPCSTSLRNERSSPMARRYTAADEPISRLAVWARRMALFSLSAVIVSIIIVRSEWLDIGPAITTFVMALAPSILALALALAALVVIWTEGLRGLGRAFAAMAIAMALLAYPAYLAYRAYKLPWLYDITTDPIDPPRYEALARLRPREANPITYAGLYAAQQQRAAYPDIEPLDADATPEVAFKAALAVVTKRKWVIIDRRPPQPTRREGHIEAVARTLIMGLRDDVVVRVRGGADGSRIDVRSSSRFGSFDFGSNAARVRSLIDEIDDAIGHEKPEPAVLPPAKKPLAPPKRDQPATTTKR
jgi:uncharacterized protein (DUF1499 family)